MAWQNAHKHDILFTVHISVRGSIKLFLLFTPLPMFQTNSNLKVCLRSWSISSAPCCWLPWSHTDLQLSLSHWHTHYCIHVRDKLLTWHSLSFSLSLWVAAAHSSGVSSQLMPFSWGVVWREGFLQLAPQPAADKRGLGCTPASWYYCASWKGTGLAVFLMCGLACAWTLSPLWVLCRSPQVKVRMSPCCS